MPVHNYYKILFLPKWYPNRRDKLNGIFIQHHVNAIAEECKVAVLYVGADNELNSTVESEITQEEKVKVVRVYYQNNDLGNSFWSKSLKFYRYLKASYIGLKIIKKEFGKPNLIHVNVLSRPGISALLLKKLNHIPYIITEHWSGYLPEDGSYEGTIKKRITQSIVKNASAVTCVSAHLAKAMKAHNLKANYSIVPNCVDTKNIPHRVNTEYPIALMIGNLEDREKNITPVIEALEKVKIEFPALKLRIIGEGVDKQKLIQRAQQLHLSDSVIFLGELSHLQVYQELCAASFLILNSNYETFSVVAAESLACGTPVLTSRCGGPEEFINSDFGKIIDRNNPTELEAGIKWMCLNHLSFDKEKMKKFAQENFNPEAIAQKFISIYHPFISTWEAGNTREILYIPHQWKVLDVGSGDHPNERADVLLEREIEASEHRSGALAVIPEGKKLVEGDATEMPFSNKEFDFVIASHIAEHIDEPEKFCSELQRVAKRGYLETPGAFSEFIFNEPFHKWVVSSKNGVLVFTEKTKHTVFSESFYKLYYLNEKRTNHEAFYSNNILILTFVKALRKLWKYLPNTYTRFHWENKFEYKVIRKPQHG